jgi:hypothetical protein
VQSPPIVEEKKPIPQVEEVVSKKEKKKLKKMKKEGCGSTL